MVTQLTTNVMVLWGLVLLTLLIVLFAVIAQNDAPELISAYVTFYNSDVSLAVRSIFVATLEYAEYFVRPFLVLWNSWWYFYRSIFTDVMLPVFMEEPRNTLRMAESVGMFGRSITASVFTYAERFKGDCSIDRLSLIHI